MTSRLLTDFAELRQLASEWDRLWESNPRRRIFGKFSWIESWWRGYGGNAQLLTPAIYHDDRCLGILPLVVQDRQLRFVGHPAADYNDLICEPERNADILGAAIAALDGSPFPWDSCALDNVPESALLLRARDGLAPRLRERTEAVVSALCPTVLLDEGRAETLRGILGKTTVSQMLRKLQKLGALTFRHLEDRQEAREHLPSLYQQHIRCRALAGIRSQLLGQPSRDFYDALVDNLDLRAELRFSILKLDDRPIAYNFGFQLDGTFVHYTPTFDIEFFDLSPGQVLLRHLFLYVQANGIREFDFTVGDETYKSRYANHIERNYTMLLYPQTSKGRLGHVAHAAKERLRKYPSAYRAAKDAAISIRASAARVHRAVRRDGFLRSVGKVAARIFRTAIYARDEMLLYTLQSADAAPALQGLTFRVATLSDLADTAVTYPEYLGDATLHDLRKRIKKGHTPFVAVDNGSIVHVVWLRVEDHVATSELGEDFVVEFGRPMGIMYDAWTPPVARGRGIYPAVLSLLCRQIRRSAAEPLIYVEADNLASRRGVEKAGMVVHKQMIRSTWLHWIRHRVVREPLQ